MKPIAWIDVYKRQALFRIHFRRGNVQLVGQQGQKVGLLEDRQNKRAPAPVSYTHLVKQQIYGKWVLYIRNTINIHHIDDSILAWSGIIQCKPLTGKTRWEL